MFQNVYDLYNEYFQIKHEWFTFPYLKEHFENKGFLLSFDQGSFLNVMIYYCFLIKNNDTILNMYNIISKQLELINI